MKRLLSILVISAFGVGIVFGSATKRSFKTPHKQKLIRKVEPFQSVITPESHPTSPIVMPSTRQEGHFVLVDSSTNGYGMVLGTTRPLIVTENDEWFFVFRQYCGENTTHGQIGAAYSEDGENWTVYTYLNTGFNWPPSTKQGRYPSALGNEDYPFAFWNEYTNLGAGYGGRPYYAYDEFGWDGGSFSQPWEVDPLWSESKDLWVGSPGYSYDIDNDEHHFNIVFDDWTRNNYYLFHSEAYMDGFIVFGNEILIIDEQNDLVPGDAGGSYNSSAALSISKDGYGMVGIVGWFADADEDASDITNYHTAIFKLTDNHGATWYGGGDYYNNDEYYFIPDNVWEDMIDNEFANYWDPCADTTSVLFDLWTYYELDMKVDSEGNPHIVLEVLPCDGTYCYYMSGDGSEVGSGFYHFTIDRDYIDDPGPVNTDTGWKYSKVVSGRETWAFSAPDGNSFILQTQASLAISSEDDEVIYVVTDKAEMGEVAGYDPEDPYDCEEPYEYYPYWSEDVFVVRSQDGGERWEDPINITNTPDDGEECDPPTMSGWCSPEEQYPHAAHWATNDKVYFVYQMPDWYFNEIGDPLGPDHKNRLYAGWVDMEGGPVTETQDISLTAGWNIFSMYLIADNMDMLSIVQPLIDAGYLDKVLDEAGNAVLYFFGNWVNNIGDLANTEGYYIKVNDDVNLSIEGTAVELPYEIYLTEGWNIMGYPTDTAQDALTIVQPLIDADELDKVLDEAGNAILYFFGNWVNNIGDFEAGEGYYVKVSTTTSLTISAPALASSNEDEDAQSSRIRTRSLDNSHFTPIWSGNPFKRMAFWMIGENFADIDLEAGDEVAVFDGDLCVGTAVVTGEQSISNPLIIHAGMDDGCGNGFEEGDVITFRILDASESSEAVVTAVTYMDPGTGNEVDNPTFESLSDYAIILVTHSEFMEVQDELGLPETFALNQNYPNPFNPVTHIPFELVEPQHVKLVIYDITGKEVLSLVNDLLLTGRYTVQVNASDLATGIYFYRIYTDKFTATKKMILLK